jgi:hypothetical protein
MTTTALIGQEKRLAMAAALIREALNTTWLLLWGRISKERWLSAINDDLRRGRSRVMKWALNKARRMAVGWVTWVKLREFEQKTPPRTKDSTACTFAVSERGAAAISVLETLSAAPSRKMSGIRQSLVIVGTYIVFSDKSRYAGIKVLAEMLAKSR